ncbi:ATP-binding cassette domain-containing protein [Moraxella canis]|uniref:ATP-binding cassette domain-containing protein n=1 Tax=Moraxella canis TaxID=90239 RepID=A0ABZ0WY74_9GAMM|nr:ATP-binding cassette domain-containing protein [Moraxella canis]WQE04176.1 ATP-binding cassette domain-containing protein [Moraxella canis]
MKPNKPFRLHELISTQIWVWILAWLLGLVTVWSVLGLSMVSGWFVTMSAVAGLVAVGTHTFNYMMPAAIIRTFAIARTLSRYGDLMVSHHAVFGLLKDLRVRFFGAWANLDYKARNLQGQSSSQKMHRLVKDIDVLDEFVLRFISPWMMAIGAVLLVAGVTLLLLPTAWFGLVSIGLAILIAALVVYRGIDLAHRESALLETRKSKLLDTLPALTSLLIWHRWETHIHQLSDLDAQQTKITLSSHRLRRIGILGVQVALALAAVLMLWGMGEFFGQADIIAFSVQTLNDYPMISSAVALAVFLGLMGLGEFIQNLIAEPLALGRSQVAKQRLNEMLGSQSDTPKVNLDQIVNQHDNLTLQLDHAVVRAPKAIISAHISHAKISSDTPCLIVGPSGSGKSTLLHTLAQEHDLIFGDIWLCTSAKRYPWQSVDFGQSLGFLGQVVDIFDQTLADNLRLGKPNATDDELIAVLKKVNLLTWLNNQPKGLATRLGEYGMAVSGGQARRIALARLLLTPKAVMMLDEPFAGLDPETRRDVWSSLIDAQKSGDIGLLLICTHQLWQEMGEVQVIRIEGEDQI